MIYRIFGDEESRFDEHIVNLLNECLGPNYYTQAKLDIRRHRGFVCVAFDEFLPVGVTTAYVLTDPELSALLPEGEWHDKLDGADVALFEASAVRSNYRGRGIGKRLFELRLEWAKDVKADYALALAWRSGQHESIGLHLSLGAQVIYEGGHSFAGVPCVRCSPAECTCVGDIVLYDLHTHEWEFVAKGEEFEGDFLMCICGETRDV